MRTELVTTSRSSRRSTGSPMARILADARRHRKRAPDLRFRHEATQARVQHRILVGRSAGGSARCGEGGRASRVQLDLDRRGLRIGRAHPARLVGSRYRTREARHRHRPDVGAHPCRDGDGRDHTRPSVERSVHPRARGFGTAGRRGVVRPVVSEAVGAHSRVHRHRAQDRRSGGSRRAPWRVLRHAAPGWRRARQGAQVDGPPVARGTADLPRRRGSEERRAGGGDLRRVDAVVLLPQGGRVLP